MTLTTILLTRGYVALIDVEDESRVSAIKWRAKLDRDGRVYACAHVPGSGHRGKSVLMHRFICGAQLGETVDHIDGDGLHNWKDNLRRCSTAQNIRNSRTHRDKSTARLKGVYRLKNGKYRAQIMCQYKKINLGEFASEEAAARCYDDNARKLHGEFARLNFPLEQLTSSGRVGQKTGGAA